MFGYGGSDAVKFLISYESLAGSLSLSGEYLEDCPAYFSDEINLITTDDSGTDEIGRQTETETGRVTAYGDIKSVSREESFTAGSHGYSNVQKFVLHPWDYSGEKYAMVDGKRKLIYRTYQADPDTLELYAATKRGIT